MKLCVVHLGGEDKNAMPKWVRKMPDLFLPFYIENRRPYTLTPLSLCEVEGYMATIHTTAKKLEQKPNKWQNILTEMLKVLCDREVVIVVPPKEGLFPANILPLSQGKAINAFFVVEGIQKALKRQELDLKNAHITLIDGQNFISKLVLDMLYPNVNFLSVYTDRQEYFSDKKEQIYEETGLVLQTFSNCKSSYMTEAHVILNCSMSLENYDYAFQKNAFYFDIIQNHAKEKRLRQRRKDLLIAAGLELKYNNQYYTSAEWEAAAYIWLPNFRNFLNTDYQIHAAKEVKELLKEKSCYITKFF